MQRKDRHKTFFSLEITNSGSGLLSGIIVFLLLGYLFACARELRFLHPVGALFQFTPLYGLELLAASVGATYGLRQIAGRKKAVPANCKRGQRAAFSFLLCFFVAFFLECTFFQYNHYGSLFSDSSISTEDPEADWSTLRLAKISLNTSGTSSISFYFSLVDVFDGSMTEKEEKAEELSALGLKDPANSADEEYRRVLEETERITEEQGEKAAYPLPITYDTNMAVARFDRLNREISSVYIEPLFLGEGNVLTGEAVKSMQVMIVYGDEDSSFLQTRVYTIVDGMEYTRYIPLYTVGKASWLSVCLIGEGAAFVSIRLNGGIPLEPVLLRMLVVALLLYMAFFFPWKKAFAVRFDVGSRKQKLVFIMLLILLFGYCLTLALNCAGYAYEPYSAGQYNRYLVDSILAGRADLDIPTSERFAAIERKYDRSYWNFLYGIEYLGEDVHWDTVFYEGKWYTYFGVVPALLLFVPYTLITGNYLSYSAACLIQGYLALVFLLLIWRRYFIKYLSELPFVLYILTSLTLAMGSFVPFLLRRSSFYETVNLGGLMFCAAGLWLLIRYRDKAGKHPIAALGGACLCFALAVGCRPIMLFSSALVPLFLWPEVKTAWKDRKRALLTMILAIAVPYIVVALPLMWYNQIRFGSPFDFGSTYQITGLNIAVQNQVNPIGKLYRYVTGVVANLFNPPRFLLRFPYVDVQGIQNEATSTTRIAHYLGAVGLFSIPVSWLLLSWISSKELRREVPMIIRFVALSIVICVLTAALSTTYCIQPRYEIDYAWLILLSALASLLPFYRKGRKLLRSTVAADRIVALLCGATVVIFFFLSFRGTIALDKGNDSMPFYFYVKRAFSFFEGV